MEWKRQVIEAGEIAISEVIVDTSQRRVTDPVAVAELASSFKEISQLNPIIIDRNNKLLAGLHRLEAARSLNWTHIRFTYFDSLDPLQQKIVEFDENHKRRQLTWQEEASAIAEIHELKSAEGQWSMRDTAKVLNVSLGKIQEDLSLAKNLSNARVISHPSRSGAIIAVRREREISLLKELARRRSNQIVHGTSDFVEHLGGGSIWNGDCLDILATIDSDSIDLIVTDPPWGISLDTSSQWTTRWVPSYDDSEGAVLTMLKDAFVQLYRVLKSTCHLYTFFPIDRAEWWREILHEAGFRTRTRPLIWFKTGQPSITDTYTSFLPCYEALLWAWKPDERNVQRFFSQPVAEAYGFPRQPGLWHENEKPTEMLERFIETSSAMNQVVLDPFAGGGSILAAAFTTGRHYIGIEKDPVNWDKCVKRMKQLEEKQV